MTDAEFVGLAAQGGNEAIMAALAATQGDVNTPNGPVGPMIDPENRWASTHGDAGAAPGASGDEGAPEAAAEAAAAAPALPVEPDRLTLVEQMLQKQSENVAALTQAIRDAGTRPAGPDPLTAATQRLEAAKARMTAEDATTLDLMEYTDARDAFKDATAAHAQGEAARQQQAVATEWQAAEAGFRAAHRDVTPEIEAAMQRFLESDPDAQASLSLIAQTDKGKALEMTYRLFRATHVVPVAGAPLGAGAQSVEAVEAAALAAQTAQDRARVTGSLLRGGAERDTPLAPTGKTGLTLGDVEAAVRSGRFAGNPESPDLAAMLFRQ